MFIFSKQILKIFIFFNDKHPKNILFILIELNNVIFESDFFFIIKSKIINYKKILVINIYQ